jgi:predicted extracellular nuclease
LLRLEPQARVVVLGDLNDYEWSLAVSRLAAPPLENLLLRLPEPDRYSYIFEGAAQLIDHVVVSPALAPGAEVDVVHVNADCADERRTSDHDPVVVRLRER